MITLTGAETQAFLRLSALGRGSGPCGALRDVRPPTLSRDPTACTARAQTLSKRTGALGQV